MIFDWLWSTPLGWLVSVLLGYVGGATIHIVIAYRAIRREARRSREEYYRWLNDDLMPKVETRLTERIAERFPAVPSVDAVAEAVGAKLPQWDSLADVTAANLERRMDLRIKSSAGVVAKQAKNSLEKILMSTQSGNAYVDGVLAAVPIEVKKEWASRIASILRKQGLSALTATDDEEKESPGADGLDPSVWR